MVDARDSLSRFAPLLRIPLMLITMVCVIGSLYFGKELLLPVALASLLSFLLTPLVRRTDRIGVPRVVGVCLVVLAVFGALGGLGWVVAGKFIDLSDNLPQYRGNLIAKARELQQMTGNRWSKASETIDEITQELASSSPASKRAASASSAEATTPGLWDRLTTSLGGGSTELESDVASKDDQAVEVKVVELPPSPLVQIGNWLGPLVAPISTAGVVIVLVIFMLIGREDLRDRILLLVGRSHLQATTEALDDATSRLSRYLRMQLLINATYGVCVACGLYLIGVPNALLWGVMATMLRFLPYLGPWLAASMPIALSLAVSSSWTLPLATILLFVVLELIVNNVLEPYLYGSSIGVSSLGIIMAAIFWTWLWGPVGLVLAMPLTVCMVVVANYVPGLRFISVVLSDQATLGADVRHYQRLLAMDADEADEIAATFAKQHSRVETYDYVLIPSLAMFCADVQAGVLREDQEEFALELLKDYLAADKQPLVAQVGATSEGTQDAPPTVSSSDTAPRDTSQITCFPANDEADTRVAEMLQNLMFTKGMRLDIASTDRLASERVDDVKKNDIRIVVISSMRATSSRQARYLVKRLRAAYPELMIIVGLWGDPTPGDRTRERIAAAGATDVAYSLAEAINQIQCRLQLGVNDSTSQPVTSTHSIACVA